jgi:UPF0755 protein
MTPRKRRSSCFLSLFLVVLALFLLAAVSIPAALILIPNQVEQTFGPPASDLSLRQRYSYALLLFAQSSDLTMPVNSRDSDQTFTIDQGESVASITGRLYQARLIPNPGAFRTFLLYSGLDKSIQAGTYTFTSSQPPLEIARSLQDATPAQVTFRILAGWRLEEIAASLPTSGLSITPNDFLAAARVQPSGYSFSSDLPANATLEGFLLPDGYVFERDISTTLFITTLLDHFEEKVTPDLRSAFARQGLNTYQAVTLASMIEKEAVIEPDMPLIASVFYNRLAIDMKLDSDPTVQYSIGYNERQQTWWTNPLSLNDLQYSSPYNTYLNKNLPPGPIAAPSLAALQAAAYPATTPYYFFRAGCDNSGRHLFAETFQEHLQNDCR